MSHPIGQILRDKGHRLLDSGDYWRMAAVFRGGRCPTSIAIKKTTGEFKDFGMSSPWRKAEDLVKMLNGESVDFSGYVVEVEAIDKIETQKTYPKEILKRLLPKYGIFPARGISIETLRLFEAGYAMGNKMGNRVCFPVYDEHGRIIGFDGRWLQDTPPENIVKWKILGRKTGWLYPIHLNDSIIREKREIIIVESIGDLLALWEAGFKHSLCIFGTSLSTKQLSYVLSVDPERIIIGTNHDEKDKFGRRAGHYASAKIVKQLTKHFAAERIVIGIPSKNDFGGMSSEEIKEWYKGLTKEPK